MNKKLIIITSAVALILSLCLFTISVFAAVGRVFGVNNRITFVGKDEYLIFTLDAEVTGTTNDGADYLKYSWGYNEDESYLNEQTWDIEETLVFNEEGKHPNEVYILYSFTIKNNINSKKIKVYMDHPNIDTAYLDFEVLNSSNAEVNEVIIDRGMTDSIKLKLKPANERFTGARACNLNLNIVGID